MFVCIIQFDWQIIIFYISLFKTVPTSQNLFVEYFICLCGACPSTTFRGSPEANPPFWAVLGIPIRMTPAVLTPSQLSWDHQMSRPCSSPLLSTLIKEDPGFPVCPVRNFHQDTPISRLIIIKPSCPYHKSLELWPSVELPLLLPLSPHHHPDHTWPVWNSLLTAVPHYLIPYIQLAFWEQEDLTFCFRAKRLYP
jgi:hypothetical protein